MNDYDEKFYVYVRTEETKFVKEFLDFHDAITYSTKYQQLDNTANVTLLVPFE